MGELDDHRDIGPDDRRINLIKGIASGSTKVIKTDLAAPAALD